MCCCPKKNYGTNAFIETNFFNPEQGRWIFTNMVNVCIVHAWPSVTYVSTLSLPPHFVGARVIWLWRVYVMCLTELLILFIIFLDGVFPYLLASGTFIYSRSDSHPSLRLLWCLSVLSILIEALNSSSFEVPSCGGLYLYHFCKYRLQGCSYSDYVIASNPIECALRISLHLSIL